MWLGVAPVSLVPGWMSIRVFIVTNPCHTYTHVFQSNRTPTENDHIFTSVTGDIYPC